MPRTYLAPGENTDGPPVGYWFPCSFYYSTLIVGSTGGGCLAYLGETSSVYGGASPPDESVEPFMGAS